MKSVIWDFDGTLFDSFEGIKKAFEQSSTDLYKVDINLPKELVGPKLKYIHDSVFGTLNNSDFEKFHLLFRRYYDKEYYLVGDFYQGTVDILQLIKSRNYNQFIISNKPQFVLNKIVKEKEIDIYFNKIIGSDPNEVTNLSKSYHLKKVIEDYKLDNSNSLVIGDGLDDYLMAKENGCMFTFAKYGYGKIDKDCNCIESITDLKKII